MSLGTDLCDRCTKLATIILHHERGDEKYCEYHWVESRKEVFRQAICSDCEKAPVPLNL